MDSKFLKTTQAKVCIAVFVGFVLVWGIINIAKSGFSFGQWLYELTH